MKKMKRVSVAAFALAVSISATAGAWGEGPFDNDDAMDWLSECAKPSGRTAITRAIEAALRPGYLDAEDGSIAVAAAQVIASADGKGPKVPGPQATACFAKANEPEVRALAPRARQALARVADRKSSELAQLWAEGKPSGWDSRIGELRARLGR
ncbi:DUF4259 domain-containing protein [Variovorax boronicumulans]|uniref:DUF4259 domain-containing protein n=1 Tax=Variovorax boronicumulans TaxID=436515 RepID=UPI0033914639